MIRFTVPEGCEATVESFLRGQLRGVRGGALEKALKNRDVKRGGKRVGARDTVRGGDVLEVYIADEFLAPAPEILYRDEMLLAVNKPRGILSVGQGSMEECVQTLYPNARACHRLDSATCGVLLFSLCDEANAELLRMFRERTIDKTYRCRVEGIPTPEQAELRAYLKKNAIAAKVEITAIPAKGALPIATRYRVLEQGADSSLLEVGLLTGRTHQIRAHLAAIGHPVVGDDLYGNRARNRARKARHLLLQAVEVRFGDTKGCLSGLYGKTIRAPVIPPLRKCCEEP